MVFIDGFLIWSHFKFIIIFGFIFKQKIRETELFKKIGEIKYL